MHEYHKIKTVWQRDPSKKYKTLIEGQYAKPEFEYLAHCQWEFTEKVDGTNIRITLDENEKLNIQGRTANAQIPAFLYNKLTELIPPEKLAEAGDGLELFGEGYGAKIQKGGGNYISDGVNFALFDVFCGGVWLSRDNVKDVARKLGVDIVKTLRHGSLLRMIHIVRDGLWSTYGDFLAEGIVARPVVELVDRSGRRIITKVKAKDFQ